MNDPQPAPEPAAGPAPLSAGPWLAEHYPDHAGAVLLNGAEFADDAVGFYHEMRRQHGRVAPVLLGDVPAWLVLTYREVHVVTSNPGLFGRDSRRWNAWERIPEDWPLRSYLTWVPSIMFAEGAEHQRRAGAVGDALDAIDRTELAAICERVADQLISGFAGTGEADLIAQYAHQIPILVVARLFGLPEADTPALTRDIIQSLNDGAEASEAHLRIYMRMMQLVKDKQESPGADVPSRMLAHPAGLTSDEVVFDLLIVVGGAQQPTGDWIGNTLRLMLIDDGFSLNLQGGRSSAAQALNEVLWKDSPILTGSRWAVQDCELGGRRIRRGDMILLGLGAANADPQVHPGTFADSGANRAHMSFGHGEHGCPFPAPELAEVIARTAVEVLLDRIPDVELALPADSLRWRPSTGARGLSSLPVRFTPVTRVGSAF